MTFPFVEMPSQADISFHKIDCFQCEYLRKDLEEYRDKEITGETVRYLHQEMSCLSAQGWQWILPHYLRFCMTPEAEHNRMETEFLIYNLGPDLKFQSETVKRLSLLDKVQINCLIHFLEECSNDRHWKNYCPNEINKAINFLRTLN